MKKIAVFSDIHGNLPALKSILEDLRKEKIKEVIYLGDIIGIGPQPKECLELLMDSNIQAVKGNHEIYQLNDKLSKDHLTDEELKHRNWIKKELNEEEFNYIKDLPMSIELLMYGKLFTFSHFFLNESKDYYEELTILSSDKQYEVTSKIETDYMFVGHSHDAFQIDNSSLFTCVGSSGCRKDDTTFYTIIEVESKSVKIHKKYLKYKRETLEKEIKENDYPDKVKMSDIFFGLKIKK